MEQSVMQSIFQGLSDSLTCAIDIQNGEAVSAVLINAEAANKGGAISDDQYKELVADAAEEGYEFV